MTDEKRAPEPNDEQISIRLPASMLDEIRAAAASASTQTGRRVTNGDIIRERCRR